MTIRTDMAAACGPETHNFETRCGGVVILKQEHLDAAAGDDIDERHDDVLADARIGCCQKCGCLSATAEFVVEGDITYVVARCAPGPGELELGHRDAPEPDGAR